ncbi:MULTISPECIES: DMT family transporter [unclassified Serratia (in: enterobacteria)]|uniref:DMT family transporter n=1 Tax=unclassified Serratia (in: enterobacteria) TaxID=2647522 RepID=UPI0004686174|nr:MULTISPECIES: DMT family transporter [unclassified Serratia (in: enterobacteria)]
MDILMGLMAAACWGGTDFLVGINARAVGVRRAVFFSQLIGLVILSLLLLSMPLQASHIPITIWGLALLAAGLIVIGALALSHAFALGKAALVAPLVTSYGAVTALLSWISGEQLGAFTVLGLAICLLGVVLTAVNVNRQAETSTMLLPLLFALLASLCYGCSFWLQGRYTLAVLGPNLSLWMGYAFGLAALLMFGDRRKLLARPTRRQSGLLLAASLLNLAGFAAFAVGSGHGSVSVVTVLSTLSGGIAALLGALLLGERLSNVQWLGVMTVLAGALLLQLTP